VAVADALLAVAVHFWCLFSIIEQCQDYTVLGIVLAWFVSRWVQHFKCSAYGVFPLSAECLVFGTCFPFTFLPFPFVCTPFGFLHNAGTLETAEYVSPLTVCVLFVSVCSATFHGSHLARCLSQY
jgi:hypothetical protein